MVTHVLAHPWVVALAAAVLALAVAWGVIARRDRRTGEPTWVANTSYLATLPAYRRRLARYRAGLGAGLGLALVGGLAAGVLAARPVERTEHDRALSTRDIVLCLDVSGSMVGYDTEIVDRFSELVRTFDGERIALAIWNQTTRTVFPLTDDYALVQDELAAAREALDFDVSTLEDGSYDPEALDRILRFIAGTDAGDASSTSLVGDGLVSCALLFDDAGEDRSRTILLATDNEVIGTPIYPLREAAQEVSDRGITTIGIYAGAPSEEFPRARAELEQVLFDSGGLFFAADDPSAVDSIIDRITASQGGQDDSETEVVTTDEPGIALAVLAGATLLLLGVVWRVRA